MRSDTYDDDNDNDAVNERFNNMHRPRVHAYSIADYRDANRLPQPDTVSGYIAAIESRLRYAEFAD